MFVQETAIQCFQQRKRYLEYNFQKDNFPPYTNTTFPIKVRQDIPDLGKKSNTSCLVYY